LALITLHNIYIYNIYGGQVSVYLVILITPTGIALLPYSTAVRFKLGFIRVGLGVNLGCCYGNSVYAHIIAGP